MNLIDLKNELEQLDLNELVATKTEIEKIIKSALLKKRSELEALNRIMEEALGGAPKASVSTANVVNLNINGQSYAVKEGRGKLPQAVLDALPAEDKGLKKAEVVAKYS